MKLLIFVMIMLYIFFVSSHEDFKNSLIRKMENKYNLKYMDANIARSNAKGSKPGKEKGIIKKEKKKSNKKESKKNELKNGVSGIELLINKLKGYGESNIGNIILDDDLALIYNKESRGSMGARHKNTKIGEFIENLEGLMVVKINNLSVNAHNITYKNKRGNPTYGHGVNYNVHI